MVDEYKTLVQQAWKIMDISKWDERDFLTTVRDLVSERERLYNENLELQDRIRLYRKI